MAVGHKSAQQVRYQEDGSVGERQQFFRHFDLGRIWTATGFSVRYLEYAGSSHWDLLSRVAPRDTKVPIEAWDESIRRAAVSDRPSGVAAGMRRPVIDLTETAW
jgi:hypothetical protein